MRKLLLLVIIPGAFCNSIQNLERDLRNLALTRPANPLMPLKPEQLIQSTRDEINMTKKIMLDFIRSNPKITAPILTDTPSGKIIVAQHTRVTILHPLAIRSNNTMYRVPASFNLSSQSIANIHNATIRMSIDDYVPLAGGIRPRSPLVSLSIFNNVREFMINGISQPINITIPIINMTNQGWEIFRLKAQCRYFDTERLLYSTEGVKLVRVERDYVVCSTTHLTDFVVVELTSEQNSVLYRTTILNNVSTTYLKILTTSRAQSTLTSSKGITSAPRTTTTPRRPQGTTSRAIIAATTPLFTNRSNSTNFTTTWSNFSFTEKVCCLRRGDYSLTVPEDCPANSYMLRGGAHEITECICKEGYTFVNETCYAPPTDPGVIIGVVGGASFLALGGIIFQWWQLGAAAPALAATNNPFTHIKIDKIM